MLPISEILPYRHTDIICSDTNIYPSIKDKNRIRTDKNEQRTIKQKIHGI